MAVQTVNGSCHRGAIAGTAGGGPETAIGCTCSSASWLGAVWTFTPGTKFKLTKGEGKDGSDQVGINLRCCEGIDVNKLSPRQVDGRSL